MWFSCRAQEHWCSCIFCACARAGAHLRDGSDWRQPEAPSRRSRLPLWTGVREMLRLCLSPAQRRPPVQPAAHAELMEQVHSHIQHHKQVLLFTFINLLILIRVGFCWPFLRVCSLEWRGKVEGRVWSVGSWWSTSTSIRWPSEPGFHSPFCWWNSLKWHPCLIFLFLVPQRNSCSPAGLLPCYVTGHFLKVRSTFLHFKASSEGARSKIWEVDLRPFSLAGFAVRQRAMWTASRGSEQSHVANQPLLPPAAHLRSGNSSFVTFFFFSPK